MSSSRHKIAAPNGTGPDKGDETPRVYSQAELELFDFIGRKFCEKIISELKDSEKIEEEV